MTKHSDNVDELLKVVRDSFGKESMVRLSGDTTAETAIDEVIPTGLAVLDHYLCAVGGLPCGRITELFGDEASGKTGLLLQFLAGCQADGGVAALIDSETSFDPERAAVFGVNVEDLLISSPDTMEDALGHTEALVAGWKPSHGPLLIGYDSLEASPLKVEIEGELDASHMGKRAQMMSQTLRRLNAAIRGKQIHIVFTNQMRTKFGVMFGDNTTTGCGKALKFYASLRLRLYSGKAIKSGAAKEHTGKAVTISAMKNRMAPPFRKAIVRLDYATGWNDQWSLLEFGKTHGIIGGRDKGDAALAAVCKYLGCRVPSGTTEIAGEVDVECDDDTP